MHGNPSGAASLEDPDYTDWKRRHPKFPGVAKCVELLRRRNTHSNKVDILCGELQHNAAAHADELIAAFQAEANEHVRNLLLMVIADVKLPQAQSVLIEQLHSPDERLRYWAEQGLSRLNTAEARKALWEAGLARARK
jgi:hypothetical protein